MDFKTRLHQEFINFIILVGILVLINIISVRTFFRIDLTKNQSYSLSEVSKDYMAQLKDPVTVKAFFTKNLPAPYNANARYLRDLLEDYRVYSKGKFNYQFVDPADDPSFEKEARSLGVYGVQLTAIAKDKFEQKNGYMGVAFIYRDRKEVLPLIQDTQGLEYKITSAIKKLIQTEMKVIGITQGHGEPDYNEELSNLNQLLAKNYEVMPVDLKESSIPERVDALIVAGPTQMVAEEKRYELDQFLRSGKNLVMLVRMVAADAKTTMQGKTVFSGLSGLTAAWGVSVQPNLVYDRQCQKIAVQQQGPGFMMRNIVAYPPFPLVTNMDPDHLIVKGIDSFTLPFVSSLELKPTVIEQNKLNATVIARSSEYAWLQKQFFMLSPQFMEPPKNPADYQQVDLAVAITGTFPSAFTKDTVPEGKSGLIEQAQPARLFVAGSSDFLTNDFIDPRRGSQLVDVTQNIVDWTAQDAALIEIRSKGLSSAAIGDISDLARQSIKYFNLIGLPILVILAGLVMWRRFENRRFKIVSWYQQSTK